MAFDPATVETFLPRRRIGRSETAVLVAASLALVVGATAWLADVDSAVSETTADVSSTFADRFVAPADRFATASSADLFHIRPSLQPLDRSALAALETKWRNARDELTQGQIGRASCRERV